MGSVAKRSTRTASLVLTRQTDRSPGRRQPCASAHLHPRGSCTASLVAAWSIHRAVTSSQRWRTAIHTRRHDGPYHHLSGQGSCTGSGGADARRVRALVDELTYRPSSAAERSVWRDCARTWANHWRHRILWLHATPARRGRGAARPPARARCRRLGRDACGASAPRCVCTGRGGCCGRRRADAYEQHQKWASHRDLTPGDHLRPGDLGGDLGEISGALAAARRAGCAACAAPDTRRLSAPHFYCPVHRDGRS